MKTLTINYLAVIVAAIVTFMLGAFWYMTFGGTWAELTGVTNEKAQASTDGLTAMIISFITYILAAYAMALIFKSMNISTWQTGAMTGALIGAFLIGGNIFTNNAYELKPMQLSVLNAGFSTLSSTVVGAILGGWRKYA